MSVVAKFIGKEYALEPDEIVDLRGTVPANDEARSKHRHVIVILPDGSEMWLDIATNADNHNHTDVRWFNPDGRMKGVGAFTMVNGHRQSFGEAVVQDKKTGEWTCYDAEPLKDTEGTPVTGHKWNGGYCVTLLVDKNGEEAAIRPSSPGNG